jgi:5-methylcytosine-specific restriction endonuclease McrA
MPKAEYADASWRAVRLAVLRRDGFVCQIRRPNCKSRATEVDHILAMSDGGDRLDLNNLRAACKSCNIAERNATLAARARGVRARESPGGDTSTRTPTRAEYIASTGYDWPAPAGGWRLE